MTTYRIQPCTLADLRAMSLSMRAMDRSEIEGAGMKVRHALNRIWRGSVDPRCAYVDSGLGWEIAAVWGDEGSMLEALGRAWLFTAPPVEKVPLAFFREARKDIAQRLTMRRMLRSSVRADYTQALRFFRLLGFTIGPAVAVGPEGVFYREIAITRTRLSDYPSDGEQTDIESKNETKPLAKAA